jgi:hypothetical protein
MNSPVITLDPDTLKQMIDLAVEQNIATAIADLAQDADWIAKIERQVNQAVVDKIFQHLARIDTGATIKKFVDENMEQFRQTMLTNFASTGIDDQATSCQLTVMDDSTVVENQLTARDLNIVNVATIKDLVVKGTVNIDNESWSALATGMSERTLEQLSQDWKGTLVAQVADTIRSDGIVFDSVKVGDELLVNGNILSKQITDTNIQQVGTLRQLTVQGETHINNNTLNVLNKRIGINTETPEKALSVWDEEVSVVIGKHKINQAYVGTNRDQALAIGVNREPQIEISADGLTTVKKLQVGLHKISHATQVPGWAGTRGDIVFNSNLGTDRVFAWVCIGGHRWETLKSAE